MFAFYGFPDDLAEDQVGNTIFFGEVEGFAEPGTCRPGRIPGIGRNVGGY